MKANTCCLHAEIYRMIFACLHTGIKNSEYKLKETAVLPDFLFMYSNLDTLNNRMHSSMCLIDFNDIKVAE